MTRPTVVLLHGVGLDRTMWDEVGALLADRFDVIALDLPGHGSRPPVAAGTTLADLAGALEAHIPTGSHLVGFSLGALVAQYLAAHRPALAATLTSVNSVCQRTEEERAAVLGRLAVAEADFTASAAASIERWYAGTDVPDTTVSATRTTLLANDVDSFLACYRVFATGDAEVAPLLAQITVPALAITGADDGGSTPEMTHRLAAALPRCEAVVVPHARHMLPVQCPQQFVDHLVGFIGEDAHV